MSYIIRIVLTSSLLVSLLLLTSCAYLLAPNVKTELVTLQAGQYSLDKTHANLTFKIQHLGLSTYVGRFNSLDANLNFDPSNMLDTQLDAIVETGSVDVNNPELENTLREYSWFNVEEFPQATFSTVSVEPIVKQEPEQESEQEFLFTGNLTLLGITKPIELKVTFHGGANNILTGKYTLGFSAFGSFKRSNFGMDSYIPLVGDEVKIEVYAEFLRN